MPCECVLRAIFRACFDRFRECADKSITNVSLEFCQSGPGGFSHRSYSRKQEEYAADFCLIAKRTLQGEEYDLFRYHYLLGVDRRMCERRMKIDSSRFHRLLRNIQEKLGRAFADQQPYGIFPLDEYFHYVNKVPVRSEQQSPKRLAERVAYLLTA